MILKTCMMTNAKCYKQTESDIKHGIVVHSTGANNKMIARYVQPNDDAPDRGEILADIGYNRYHTDWNHKQVDVGVHAFIGANDAGTVEVYHVMPYEKNAWGSYKGPNGSYNYGPEAKIQFETCEDSLKDEKYFEDCMRTAIEYCAYLCKENGWTEQSIRSHHEAYLDGKGSDHGDIDHWLAKFSRNMDWFRAEVKKLLDDEPVPTEIWTRGTMVVLKPDAVQYTNGKEIPGWVRERKPLYVLSDDGETTTFSTVPSLEYTGRVYHRDLIEYSSFTCNSFHPCEKQPDSDFLWKIKYFFTKIFHRK